MKKQRIDLVLVEKGLAPTRQKAQAIILTGNVLVDDEPVTKPGQTIDSDATIRVRGQDHPYVSRGGVKLAAALDRFGVAVEGRLAVDIGASTGGVTHVLLLRGIRKVFAIDVGQNQLDWKIRQDPRVAAFEKINARTLDPALIGEKADVIVVDVSFISLEKILPALVPLAHSETDWITLIKPQF